MKTTKWRGFFRLAWMTAAVMALALLVMTREAKAPVDENLSGVQETPVPAASAAKEEGRLSRDCPVVQTMAFTRCGHSVTRRVSLPEALAGGSFADAQGYYALWQIDSFSPDQLVMSREIDLFCPMHSVLGPNDAGEIVLSRNLYGDGMAVVKDYGVPLEQFDGDARQQLLLGLGFDTQEEAEAWIKESQKESVKR